MAVSSARDVLILYKHNDIFEPVIGMRSNSISFNSEAVDVTHSQSSGNWRELLSGGGVKKAQITGSGVFCNFSSDNYVKNSFFSGESISLAMIIPEFGRILGNFSITGLEYKGEYDSEIVFDFVFESAGELSFAEV